MMDGTTRTLVMMGDSDGLFFVSPEQNDGSPSGRVVLLQNYFVSPYDGCYRFH